MKLLSFLAATLLTLPAWAELPPLPRPATSFGAAICDNRIYVYGGNTGKAHEFHRDCVRGDFLALNTRPEPGAWQTLSDGEKLLSPALVTWQESVIRLGGMTAKNAKEEPNDLYSTDTVEQFDPKTSQWKKLPSLPEPRSSHDASILDHTLYVGGGWRLHGHSNGDWYKTLLTLDLSAPEKGWQEQPQPFQRRALATVTQGGRVWFIGGMDSEDKPSREVDWYEPATRQWGHGPTLPDGPMAGFGIAACVVGEKLFVSPLSGVVYQLSASGEAWEQTAKLRAPRFFHRLLPMADGTLLAIGGSGRQDHILELEAVRPGSAPAEAPAAEAKDEAAKPAAPASGSEDSAKTGGEAEKPTSAS